LTSSRIPKIEPVIEPSGRFVKGETGRGSGMKYLLAAVLGWKMSAKLHLIFIF
jgi:hypothetical protein